MISNIDELELRQLDVDGLVNVSARLLFGKEAGVGCIGRIYTLHKGGYSQPHMHAWCKVFYVLAGEGIIVINGIEHYVKSGAYCVIPAKTEHRLKNISDNDFSVMSIAEEETEFNYGLR